MKKILLTIGAILLVGTIIFFSFAYLHSQNSEIKRLQGQVEQLNYVFNSTISQDSDYIMTSNDDSLVENDNYIFENETHEQDPIIISPLSLANPRQSYLNSTMGEVLGIDHLGNIMAIGNISTTNFIFNKNLVRLGIGTTSPTHTLNVAGTTNITGWSYFGENITIIADNANPTNQIVLDDLNDTAESFLNSSTLVFDTQVYQNFLGTNYTQNHQWTIKGYGSGEVTSPTDTFLISNVLNNSFASGVFVNYPAFSLVSSGGAGTISAGIGTRSPTHTLNVVGTANITGNTIFQGLTTLLANLTVNTTTFKVNANKGRVGIGTINPTHTLNIAGVNTIFNASWTGDAGSYFSADYALLGGYTTNIAITATGSLYDFYGLGDSYFSNNIQVLKNVTIGKVLTLGYMGGALPNCNTAINGSFMRNQTGLLYCQMNATWTRIAG